MTRQIGVINAGSSSIKFAIINDDPEQSLLFRGQMEKIGVGPSLTVEGPAGEKLIEKEWGAKDIDHHSGTRIILESCIALLGGETIEGIGHRVVHGGTSFAAPTVVTKDVVASLKALCPLAPLHQPHNLTRSNPSWRRRRTSGRSPASTRRSTRPSSNSRKTMRCRAS
jgi:acetate kinase